MGGFYVFLVVAFLAGTAIGSFAMFVYCSSSTEEPPGAVIKVSSGKLRPTVRLEVHSNKTAPQPSLSFLIDTGATYSIVTQKSVDVTGLITADNGLPKPPTQRLANGKKESTDKMGWTSIKVKIAGKFHSIPCFVLPRTPEKFTPVLGRTGIIDDHAVHFDAKGGNLYPVTLRRRAEQYAQRLLKATFGKGGD